MVPTSAIPTEGDLIGLPYFAILALGVRSARYVEPVFRSWKQAPDEHVGAVSDAIQAVEDLAGCPDSDSREPHWVPAVDAALLAAVAASVADCESAPTAALHAADSAAELANAIDRGCPRAVAARAVARSFRASATAMAHSGSGEGQFVAQIRRDVENMRVHASGEGWTDETGVPVRVLDS